MPSQARLACDEDIDAHADAIDLPHASLEAIVSLLRLARTGGEIPRLTRRQTDPANRILSVHIRHQTGQRLRLARYVLGPLFSLPESRTTREPDIA